MGENRKIFIERGELYYLENKAGSWEIIKIAVVGSENSTLFPTGIHQIQRVASGPDVVLGDIWDKILEIDERDLVELCAKKLSPEQALMISCVKKQAYHSQDLSELTEEVDRRQAERGRKS